jgi:hypothetical protein
MYPWLIYAITCWTFAAVWLFAGWRFAGSQLDWIDWRQSWPRLVVLLLLSPLWLPIALGAFLYAFAHCMFWEWRAMKCAGGYREAQFHPVALDDLPDDTFRRFQRQSCEFVALGMEQLGDYFNKPEPVPVWNRYFRGFEGAVFGDLTDLFDECPAGFLSVLADGTYVETAGCADLHLPDAPQPDDGLRIGGGLVGVAALCQMHLDAVRDEAERRGTDILAFDDDQLAEVAIYGQRKFYGWRRRAGENVGHVPEPVLPSGRAVRPADFALMQAAGCA